MTTETNLRSIELPGLTSTHFGTSMADVNIATDNPGLEHPILSLEGEDDAFKHSFENGILRVNENDQDGTVINQIINGRGSSRVVVSGVNQSRVIIGSGSVIINGVRFTSGDTVNISGSGSMSRKASLLLPLNHPASHRVDTMSGDVEFKKLSAKALRVASQSGSIAIFGTQADDIRLNTMSGSIEIEDTISQNPVDAESMSGSIDISASKAPSWRLSTMSGNIRVKGSEGVVDASTMSGRTKIS